MYVDCHKEIVLYFEQKWFGSVVLFVCTLQNVMETILNKVLVNLSTTISSMILHKYVSLGAVWKCGSVEDHLCVHQAFFQQWNDKSQVHKVQYWENKDRLTVCLITSSSSDKHSFKSHIIIVSRSHDFNADERICFDISSFVAGFNDTQIDITPVSSHWLSVLMLGHNPVWILMICWIKQSANCSERSCAESWVGSFCIIGPSSKPFAMV